MSGYSYDAAGNMTSDGLHTYTYDANGNVIAVDGGNTATYLYNALNQRVEVEQPGSDSEGFVYNIEGQHVSGWDMSTGGWSVGWVHWGNRQVAIYKNSVTYFDQPDWEDTERMRTKYDGSVDGTFASLPFGDGYTVTSGEDIDPRHFAMLDRDVNDNGHVMFREYSSMTGRWMSSDPYSGSYNIYNPQSFNRYAYVLNNPTSLIDPLGLQSLCGSYDGTPLYCSTTWAPDPWWDWGDYQPGPQPLRIGDGCGPMGSACAHGPWGPITRNNPPSAPSNSPGCTAARMAAARLGTAFENASKTAGLFALGSAIGTAISGAGEGVTFGGDTPVTITFGAATDFFGGATFAAGTFAVGLKSFAAGNTTALSNFDWNHLAGIAASATASRVPGLAAWAETIGNLAEQGSTLANQADEACY
jgi:RHS repeat-associated protein